MGDYIEFEYENEDSIDINLKCGICNDPFIDPVETLCHHSFCFRCLNQWFENSKLTCPTCRKIISRLNSKRITLLSFLSMLNQIHVQCKLCQQSNIQRGNFHDHIDKYCAKVIVQCSAYNHGCLWTGYREELSNHLMTCSISNSEENVNQQQCLIGIPVNITRKDIK